MLRLTELEIGYGGRALLPPVTFEVAGGQLWALMGPNGCGKTTLLRTALGLVTAIRGRVTWSSMPRIGYVPQRAKLDLSVPARAVDVVRGGTERGWSFLHPIFPFTRRAIVQRALRDVDADRLAGQPFRNLSEGQKQRVLIGRALASDPRVLVLDEPTAAMDISAEQRVFELIDDLRRERELAVLLVSHHISLVGAHATHAAVLDRDHQWVVAGPIDKVADDDRVHELYGNLLRDAVAQRSAAE